MLHSKRSRRTIAVTLLLVMTTNTLAPTVSYALTSGPTQPEVSGFEPVDTSDMVNLQTGDLTYNVPLIEVPGPEGGYPLALSYHAGVQPGMEASWVGLGWSLNPGAITRDVNGYPDDYRNIKMTRRDFWVGGSTSTFQVGLNIGLAGSPASLSAGISVSQDTYKGFGVGLDVGIGASYGNFGVNASIGISPYGGAYASVAGSIGYGSAIGSNLALGISGTASITTNFESVNAGVSAGGGLSYFTAKEGYDRPLTHTLLGASISSNGTKPALSVGGLTAMAGNSNAGRIQTSSSGFGLSLPITPVLGFYIGKRKVRYWSDETLNVYTNGSLNMEFPVGSTGPSSGFDNHAFDTYHLYDDAHYNMVDNPDPRVALGGTFPDNDQYNVSAQGLGGNIRPYAFHEELYVQNDKVNTTKEVRQYVAPYPTSLNPYVYPNPQNIQYRFVNDFSNRYLQVPQPFNFINPSGNIYYLQLAFDGAPIYGNGDGTTGYNDVKQQLAGSKHIEYVYNGNMLPGQSHAGFYETSSQGFVRRGVVSGGTEAEQNFNYQIGGFKITNESGVSYHYMLPAYSGSEYAYTRQKGTDASFNWLEKNASYAYAWMLTAMTGPDYVDANADGVINEGDWGYWVVFDYGKWCDNYIWRNPDVGYQPDLDHGFESQAAGKKELYYLNKIKTATHTAIFEKAARFDGKSASNVTSTTVYGGHSLYNGGFDGTSKSMMRLDRILLFRNSDISALTTNGGSLSGHFFNNMFDASDIPAATAALSQRAVAFSYDYSLCPGTVNSYDYSSVATKYGKTTLTRLSFRGSNNGASLPPLQFRYEPDTEEILQSSVTTAGTDPRLNFSGSAIFTAGDMVKFTSGTTYYCVIKKVNATYYEVQYLNSSTPSNGLTVTASITKNPPYNKDNYDMWNMYKSDYQSTNLVNGENYARTVSTVSSKSVDAWSLQSITSSLGNKIRIKYESDAYSNAVLEQTYKVHIYQYAEFQSGSFWPAGAYFTSNTDNKFYYKIRNPEVFDGVTLQVGDRFDAIMIWRKMINHPYCNPDFAKALDTKAVPDSYLEIVDMTYYNQYKILGLKLYNIMSVVQPSPPNSSNCGDVPLIGNLLYSAKKYPKDIYGGGLRVRSIASIGDDGRTQRTLYNYSYLTSSLTSGVTSFEPGIFDEANFQVWNPHSLTFTDINGTGGLTNYDGGKKEYRKKLGYHNMNLISITRELPPPGVMYEYVTVQNEVLNTGNTTPTPVEGKTTYQFEVFKENMVGVKELSNIGPATYPGESNPVYTLERRSVALKNSTTRVGNLKRIMRYDHNNKILSETVNTYLHDGLVNHTFDDFYPQYEDKLWDYNYQGITKENFVNMRYIRDVGAGDWGQRKAVNSVREVYPSILVSQTNLDHKHNTKSSSQNIGFDFYSGVLTKKIDIDAYGNRFLSERVPAYTIYPEMGLKLYDSLRKNMLTQEAASYVYKVNDVNTKLGLVSAWAHTWSSATNVLNPLGNTITQNGGANGKVWRKSASYEYLPDGKTTDGITAMASFTDINFSSPSGAWKKTGEATLYDTYSHLLEGKDFNDKYSTAKMGYNSTKVILNATLARYHETAYSGAEDEIVNGKFGGDVAPGQGIVQDFTSSPNSQTHTGYRSLKVIPGQAGFSYTKTLEANKKYEVTVWVKTINGSAPTGAQINVTGAVSPAVVSTITTKAANGWYLVQAVFNGSASSNTVIICSNAGSVDMLFDDFRLQPVYSSARSFVYDKYTGTLTHIIDENNLYTRYEYDPGGRLVRIFKEKLGVGEFKTEEYGYNYSATKFTSQPVNQNFTKTDCPPGQVGAAYPVNLPAGAFVSYESEADATFQAQQYGQVLANRNGSCTVCQAPSLAYVSYGGTTSVFVLYGAPAGANTCTIMWYDYQNGQSSQSTQGCNPRNITLPTRGHTYKIWIVSYSSGCPPMESNYVDFYLPL